MPMDLEDFQKLLGKRIEAEAEEPQQTMTPFPTFAEMFPKALEELEEEERTKKPTNYFFLPALKCGHLYTIIAPSNAGKTWFSLSTALSLAREGRKVLYVSTEDSEKEIVSYTKKMYENTENKSFLSNLFFDYRTHATKDAFRNFLRDAIAVADILIFDYVRPDFIERPKQTDNIYTMISDFYDVLRDFIATEGSALSVIQTIQANPEMYRADILAEVIQGSSKLATYIDGGNTTYRRSQAVAILYYNEIENKRYIIPIKAKHTDFQHRNKLIGFQISEETFTIEYDKDLDGSLYYQEPNNLVRTGFSGNPTIKKGGATKK